MLSSYIARLLRAEVWYSYGSFDAMLARDPQLVTEMD